MLRAIGIAHPDERTIKSVVRALRNAWRAGKRGA